MSHGDKAATPKQRELIDQLLIDYPDSKAMYEYEDFMQDGNRENASELISSIMDQNMTEIAEKENYIGYIANRPRVERLGEHGLFSDAGVSLNLDEITKQVGEHTGTIWTHIISLNRVDAERLGFDHAISWMNLCRAKRNELAEAMRIDPDDLVWYGAFHNESHHPHIHMVAYSKNSGQGFVTQAGIHKIRSMFASEIFHQDLMQIYRGQTGVRNELKQYSRELVESCVHQLQNTRLSSNEVIMKKIVELKSALHGYHGRTVYAYLPKAAKQVINDILIEIEKDENVKILYEQWKLYHQDITQTYHKNRLENIPLREQKEFKSMKNMILQEVLKVDMDKPSYDEQLSDMDVNSDITGFGEISIQQTDNFPIEKLSLHQAEYRLVWSKAYRKAAAYFYGSQDIMQDHEQAERLLLTECEKHNVLAYDLLAKLLEIKNPNDPEAEQLYHKAFNGFMVILANDQSEFVQSYLHYRIGKMHYYGKGTEQSYEEAYHHFKESDSEYAYYSLGTMYQRGLFVEQSNENAFMYFEKAAKAGNAFACYEVGYFYEHGIVVKQDDVKAQVNYQMAYEKFKHMADTQADDHLWYRLGEMTYYGKGTDQNVDQAKEYLNKAVSFENEDAKYMLAKIYLSEYDYAHIPQAIKWLKEAKNPHASYLLGMEYKKGLRVERDIEKAIHYLSQSAEHENSYAMVELSKIYRQESKVYDVEKAMEFLEKAVSLGNESAQITMGNELLKGEIIEKNIEKAVGYLTQAADKNNMFAQYILGKLFLFGKEVEQDKVKAKEYLEAAAVQGNLYASFLLEHMEDYHHQPLALLTSRFFHHLSRIFSNSMPCDHSPLSGVDKKLMQKIRMKKIAQGHHPRNHEINIR